MELATQLKNLLAANLMIEPIKPQYNHWEDAENLPSDAIEITLMLPNECRCDNLLHWLN